MTALPSLIDAPEHAELREAVRRACRELSPVSSLLSGWSSGLHDDTLWKTLVADLAVTELDDRRALAIVCEELGRAVAAVPYLPSAVLAGCAAQVAGANISREVIATLGVRLDSAPRAWSPSVAATQDNDGLRLTGKVTAVLAAEQAHAFLVPAHLDGVVALTLATTPVVAVSRGPQLDETRPFADVEFRETPAELLAVGDRARLAVDEALLHGVAMLAAEQLGVAEQTLDDVTEYLRGRYQFGRALGSFQALRHRMADLWTALSGARAAVRYAAAALDEGLADREVAVFVAGAVCTELALQVTEEALQLYGGYGFTWEAPVHLFLKRAAASLPLLGTPDQHRTALARLVNLPPADSVN
jgi:alkylation response protein AidB-like acyl-CoA dehydrogenase